MTRIKIGLTAIALLIGVSGALATHALNKPQSVSGETPCDEPKGVFLEDCKDSDPTLCCKIGNDEYTGPWNP